MASKSVPLHVFTEIEAELPRLRDFARCLTPNPTAAEDLVQEAAARALAGSHRRPAEVALGPWLMSLVHNLHLDLYREPAQEARPHPWTAGEEEQESEGHDHRLMRRALRQARMMLPRRPQSSPAAAFYS